MTRSTLERKLLWAAALGRVLDHAQAPREEVGAVYRKLTAEGLLTAQWHDDDVLPRTVELTTLARELMRDGI